MGRVGAFYKDGEDMKCKFTKGNIPWNKGIKYHKDNGRRGLKHSEATKTKISLSLQGHHVSQETVMKSKRFGIENGKWKGGSRMSMFRTRSKRKLLGSNNINEPFEGSEGHHIDKENVIFIPKWLHHLNWHCQKYPRTMEKINSSICYWLILTRVCMNV
jgi:hypothetical protein